MNSEERNYHAEALAIVKGESRMLPERGHLMALAGAVGAAMRRARQSEDYGVVLAAVMLDNGALRLPIPGSIIRAVKAKALALEIQPLRDDAVEVVLLDATPRVKPIEN